MRHASAAVPRVARLEPPPPWRIRRSKTTAQAARAGMLAYCSLCGIAREIELPRVRPSSAHEAMRARRGALHVHGRRKLVSGIDGCSGAELCRFHSGSARAGIRPPAARTTTPCMGVARRSPADAMTAHPRSGCPASSGAISSSCARDAAKMGGEESAPKARMKGRHVTALRRRHLRSRWPTWHLARTAAVIVSVSGAARLFETPCHAEAWRTELSMMHNYRGIDHRTCRVS